LNGFELANGFLGTSEEVEFFASEVRHFRLTTLLGYGNKVLPAEQKARGHLQRR
jgi:hypothetical protein